MGTVDSGSVVGVGSGTGFSGLIGTNTTVVGTREVLVVRKLAALEMERRIVAPPKGEEMEKRKHRLGQQVKDTVPDHLGVRANHISAIAQTPSNLLDSTA